MGENLSNSCIRAPRFVPYSSSSSNLEKSKNINVDLGQGEYAKEAQRRIKSGIEDLGLNSKRMNTYGWKQTTMTNSTNNANRKFFAKGHSKLTKGIANLKTTTNTMKRKGKPRHFVNSKTRAASTVIKRAKDFNQNRV